MAFEARSLYRKLLRYSNRFADYNFREYSKRRTQDAFREHRGKADEGMMRELLDKGWKDVRMLERQSVISQFYQLDKLVVEGAKKGAR